MSVEIKRITGRKVRRFATTIEDIDLNTGETDGRDYVIDVQTVNAEGLEALIPLIAKIAFIFVTQSTTAAAANRGDKKAQARYDAEIEAEIKKQIPDFIESMPAACRKLVYACSTIYKSVRTPYEIGTPLDEVKDPIEKESILNKLDVSSYANEIFDLTDMGSILKNQISLLTKVLAGQGGSQGASEETPSRSRS